MWHSFKRFLGMTKNEKRNEVDEVNVGDISEVRDLHPFSIYSHPADIHKYLEQRMDEVMREMFHFGGLDLSTPRDDFFFGDQKKTNSLRDSLIKPGFTNTSKKTDEDLDGKINSADIQQFFDGPSSNAAVSMPEGNPNFTFKTVTVRSIRRPDGSVETIKTVKDNTGHEETIVTHQTPVTPASPLTQQ